MICSLLILSCGCNKQRCAQVVSILGWHVLEHRKSDATSSHVDCDRRRGFQTPRVPGVTCAQSHGMCSTCTHVIFQQLCMLGVPTWLSWLAVVQMFRTFKMCNYAIRFRGMIVWHGFLNVFLYSYGVFLFLLLIWCMPDMCKLAIRLPSCSPIHTSGSNLRSRTFHRHCNRHHQNQHQLHQLHASDSSIN